eukprot:3698932-Pyramimonas_sp.AAC.1
MVEAVVMVFAAVSVAVSAAVGTFSPSAILWSQQHRGVAILDASRIPTNQCIVLFHPFHSSDLGCRIS